MPALLPPSPTCHQFRDGFGRFYPAQDNLDYSGDGDSEEHTGQTPDQPPEHQEKKDGYGVQVHAFSHQFWFYDIPDHELKGR